MYYQLCFDNKLRGEIALPLSKSIANRAFAITAMAGNCPKATQAGDRDCNDVKAMRNALLKLNGGQFPCTIDIGAAGTAMRFLTAICAAREGAEVILTGSDRMKHRPIGLLVDALVSIGADIRYAEKEGFPPLAIVGKKLCGGRVALSANVSSQYISALLMVAPYADEGLELCLEGRIMSRPYIDMTLGIMKAFGAKAGWADDNRLVVERGGYDLSRDYAVEPDWSAASYWYEMVALSADEDACIQLTGLHADSLQGDSSVALFFNRLGVATSYEPCGVTLRKCPMEEGRLALDLSNQPDLAQTLVVAAVMKGRPFVFSGLESLRIKETDRIAALVAELAKLGVTLSDSREGCLAWDGKSQPSMPAGGIAIDTYDDHRMAMAFAPVAMRFAGLRINSPSVVAKSYPAFWHDLKPFLSSPLNP